MCNLKHEAANWNIKATLLTDHIFEHHTLASTCLNSIFSHKLIESRCSFFEVSIASPTMVSNVLEDLASQLTSQNVL